jgi:DNA mismatch repair protein MSH6
MAVRVQIGATDRIISGESTFMVECNECASILENATQSSLVVFDELGRGTSTFDGYAIAHAVLEHMVSKIGCRMLFATHYHALNRDFASECGIQQAHMAARYVPTDVHWRRSMQFCLAVAIYLVSDWMVRKRSKHRLVRTRRVQGHSICFEYRLKAGACPKSYGLQVARRAGIPDSICQVSLLDCLLCTHVLVLFARQQGDQRPAFLRTMAAHLPVRRLMRDLVTCSLRISKAPPWS